MLNKRSRINEIPLEKNNPQTVLLQKKKKYFPAI